MRKNLIDTRRAKKITQAQLANILEVSVRHYQALEAGTSNGTVPIWEQLKIVLNKSIDFLLAQETKKPICK